MAQEGAVLQALEKGNLNVKHKEKIQGRYLMKEGVGKIYQQTFVTSTSVHWLLWIV